MDVLEPEEQRDPKEQQDQLRPMFQTLIRKLKATFKSGQSSCQETETRAKRRWIGMLNLLSMSGMNQTLKL
jgi:hypothetical protein